MSKSDPIAPKGTITRDPELASMAAIAKALNGLDPDIRRRVLSWITAKWPAEANG